jgi:hypothetical protein
MRRMAGQVDRGPVYQVSAHNPLLLGATMAVLAARRASLVNPVEALRAE